MKIKHAMMTLALAAGTVLVPSCATMANVNNVSQRQANTVTEVVGGTIIVDLLERIDALEHKVRELQGLEE